MTGRIDWAAPDQVDAWVHHPVAGDPSFDGFTRWVGNPVVTGRQPHEWTVNGSLFIDPPTGDRYLYVGLYPRGYWPAGGCQAFVSRDGGRTWKDLGVVLEGSPFLFDGDGERPGGTPDVSVVFHDGLYHMLYDWATWENDRGGVAYAVAKHPAGPFHRARHPIHVDANQEPLLGRYVRMYAATLLRRRNDWLVLAMMSTPGNAGGTWALVAMTASQPDGPYGAPTLLLYPQSDRYHPSPVEFFPAFAHGERVYAPATSVARNRSYQVLYAAPLEEAHEPDLWEIVLDGSVWHDEPVPHEATGIWGQTIAGAVDGRCILHVLFPSKTTDDVGTIGLASRRLDRPFRRGFVVSAPNAPSLGLMRSSYDEFALSAELHASGPFAIVWGHTAPLGPDRPFGADAEPHPRTLGQCLRWEFRGRTWTLARLNVDGAAEELASGDHDTQPGTPVSAAVECNQDHVSLRLSRTIVWQGEVRSRCGRLGVLAQRGSIVRVHAFLIAGEPRQERIVLLPTEGTMGSGASRRDWRSEEAPCFRFGFGCRSISDAAAAKWNYRGKGFRLWSPKGPGLGKLKIRVDGKDRAPVDLVARSWEKSTAIYEDLGLAKGLHTVMISAGGGAIVCDVLEYVPE